MDNKKAIENQYCAIEGKIGDAKETGKTRFFVQPLYDENVQRLKKAGLTIQRIRLLGQPYICFDIVDLWGIPEGSYADLTVETEEFMALLKMMELGL